jgi:hypothetical protein
VSTLTKCRFCNADSISRFILTSFDGHTWEADLCLDDALLMQSQGYSVKAKKKDKKVEEIEETKGKEKV